MAVISGKQRVSIAAFAAWGILAASGAGRPAENGVGLDWLVRDPQPATVRLVCSEPATGEPASLVFEKIALDDAQEALPELFAENAREVVNFDWNPATGELSYRTTTATKIFSDLESPATRASALAALNCGSR